MRLQVKPIYGWGWRAPDNSLIETPEEFVLEAEQTLEGIITGRVSHPGHPLDSMWLRLSQRHVEKDGVYNLRAYLKNLRRLPTQMTSRDTWKRSRYNPSSS